MTEKAANSVPVIRDVYLTRLFGGTGTTIHLHVDQRGRVGS